MSTPWKCDVGDTVEVTINYNNKPEKFICVVKKRIGSKLVNVHGSNGDGEFSVTVHISCIEMINQLKSNSTREKVKAAQKLKRKNRISNKRSMRSSSLGS